MLQTSRYALATCVTGLALLILALPAHATRPFTETESAVALSPGSTKVEIGLAHEEWGRGDNVYALKGEFSYSLYANLDLELEVPYEVSGGSAPFADGIGDTWAKAKINFVKERAANPLTLSGLLGVRFPTGDGATGTDEVDVSLVALASKPFAGVTAHANLSYIFVGDDGALDLDDVFGIAIGLEFDTGYRNIRGVGELVWEQSRQNTGERIELLGGAVYPLSESMQLDAAARLGLEPGAPPNDAGPDLGITVGLSFLLPPN